MMTQTWGIDILFKKLTPEIGFEFEKHTLHTMPMGGGDFIKSLSSFLMFLVVTFTLMA